MPIEHIFIWKSSFIWEPRSGAIYGAYSLPGEYTFILRCDHKGFMLHNLTEQDDLTCSASCAR